MLMKKVETAVNTNEKADGGQNALFPEEKQMQTTRNEEKTGRNQ